MFELVTMVVRQGMLIGAGILVSKGYADSSLIEPIVAFGLAVFAVGWRVVEARYFKKILVQKVATETVKQVVKGEKLTDKIDNA